MEIKVLFLGPARDLAGTESSPLEVPESCTADQLKSKMSERFPKFASSLRSIRIAVNCTFVSGDHRLRPADEVAIIPPVSGG